MTQKYAQTSKVFFSSKRAKISFLTLTVILLVFLIWNNAVAQQIAASASHVGSIKVKHSMTVATHPTAVV